MTGQGHGPEMAGLAPFFFVDPSLQVAPVGRLPRASGCTQSAVETIGQAHLLSPPPCAAVHEATYIADCWEERESKIYFLGPQMI